MPAEAQEIASEWHVGQVARRVAGLRRRSPCPSPRQVRCGTCLRRRPCERRRRLADSLRPPNRRTTTLPGKAGQNDRGGAKHGRRAVQRRSHRGLLHRRPHLSPLLPTSRNAASSPAHSSMTTPMRTTKASGPSRRASCSTGSRIGTDLRVGAAVREVVRRRQAERVAQLSRPPCRSRHAARRSRTSGKASRATRARSPTPSCSPRCSGSPTP